MRVLSGTLSRSLSCDTLTVTHTDIYGGTISVPLKREKLVRGGPYVTIEDFTVTGHYTNKSLRNKINFIFDLIYFGVSDKRFLPRDVGIPVHLNTDVAKGSFVKIEISGNNDDAELSYSDGSMFCNGTEVAGFSGSITVKNIPNMIRAAYDTYMAPSTYIECYDK